MLNDRAYIGEIQDKGIWYPGKHHVLIDRATWDRAQVLFGNRQQVAHALAFAGDLIDCGYCGHKITGEIQLKQTKNGQHKNIDYRCTKYNKPGHPRTRIKEGKLDSQVLALLDQIRIDKGSVRDRFRTELASRVFELSQTLREKRLTAGCAEKWQILEIVRLNCRLDDATLVPTI